MKKEKNLRHCFAFCSTLINIPDTPSGTRDTGKDTKTLAQRHNILKNRIGFEKNKVDLTFVQEMARKFIESKIMISHKIIFPVFIALCYFLISPLSAYGKEQKWKEYYRVNQLNKRSWENRRRDIGSALVSAQQALEVSKALNYPLGKAYAYKNIASIKLIQAEFNSALQYAKLSRTIFFETGNQTETANLYNLEGLIYSDMGENQKAIAVYENAIRLSEELQDESLTAIVLGNMGIIFYRLGAYNTALDYYYKALKIQESLHDAEALSNSLMNIGLLFMTENKYHEALEFFHLSLKIDLDLNDRLSVSICYNNIGTCHFNMGNMMKSLHYHKMALDFARESQNKKLISFSQNNIGAIFFAQHHYKEADSCYRQSLKLKQEIIDVDGEITVLLNLSNLNFETRNSAESKKWAEKALQVAERIHSLNRLRDCYEQLWKIAEAEKLIEESYACYKKYVLYSDSIKKQETGNHLQRLQLMHDTEKKEKELTLLEKEKTIESNKKIFYAIASVLIFILSFFLLRNQVVRNKKERQLRLQEKELEKIKQQALAAEIEKRELLLQQSHSELMSYTQSLLEKNKQLEELQKHLGELDLTEDELKEKNRREKMQRLSQTRIVTEEDWEQFKRLFENVFSGFFIKLRETYPGITTSEIRLAALLKLRLSTKEIATMTGVSADTVKKTRQRIRKKMNLSSETGLEDLINRI